MKRLSSMVLVVIMVLSLMTGCGKTKQPVGQQGTENSSAPASPKGNITFMVIDSFTKDKEQPLYKAVDEFMQKYPDIKVTIEPVPATNIKDKFTTSALSGAGPDVVSLDSAGWAIDAAAAGLLAPLDEKFKPIKDQYYEGPVNSGVFKDKYYAVPWYMNNMGLYYNKKILADAGISAPPTTWDELTEDIEKINKIGKKGIILPYFFPSYVMYAFFYQAGNDVIDTTGSKPKSLLMTDSGKEAFKYLAELQTKYNAFPESMKDAMSWDQTYAPFAREEVAFMFCGDWGDYGVSSANKDLDYGIAPLPKGKEAASVLGGYTLSINKNTKSFDAAWTFIEWLTAKEQNHVLLDYGRIGARKDIDTDALATKMPYLKTFIDQSSVTKARPQIIGLAEFDEIFSNAFKKVYLGQGDADTVLQEADAKVNDFINSRYK